MINNKLNIAIIGYGKMGKTIEKVALSRGHSIGLKISGANLDDFNEQNLKGIDVAIEFSTPKVARTNLSFLAQSGIATVCGTTAWLSAYEEITQAFEKQNCPFLYASNFSVGVNVFFALNQYLAKIMDGLEAYDIKITESHHIEKKDAPSGTAVTLAEDIIANIGRKQDWSLDDAGPQTIDINSIREGDVKGMHQINYKSDIDQIQLKHEAFSREGFALGAVIAAEWIVGKSGIFSMGDVLKINK